jgi:hypothetical protein
MFNHAEICRRAGVDRLRLFRWVNGQIPVLRAGEVERIGQILGMYGVKI